MKRGIYFIFVVFVLLAVACNKDDISVFNGKHQIYFDKFYMNALSPGTEQADTTRASFFFYPDGTKSIQVKLAVQLSGTMLTSDLHFGLKAITDDGTAQAEEYALEEQYTFHARPVVEGDKEIRDTITVTLHRSDRLVAMGEEGIRLVVELVPNEAVELGQYERRRAVIVWTTVEPKPAWWDYEVQYALLGEYSYEKYKLFLEVVEGANEFDGEMIKESPAKAIDMVNRFKKWLNEHLDDPVDGEKYRRILDSLI